MTIEQFRRALVNKARANRDDHVDRYEADRDAAIGAAHHDCRAHTRAADVAFRRTVEAINCGEYDAYHDGDAA